MSLKQKISYLWGPSKEKTTYWLNLLVVTLLREFFLCNMVPYCKLLIGVIRVVYK